MPQPHCFLKPLQGKSLLEVSRDECSERGMLMTASHVLDHIHSVVFMLLHQPAMVPATSDPTLQPW